MNEPKLEDLAMSHDHYCVHSRYLNLRSLANWQVDNRNYSDLQRNPYQLLSQEVL